MTSAKQQYYSGSSGLVLPVSKDKYPRAFRDKSRLEYYASLFNSIEINSIFYKLPRSLTIVKWAEGMPDNFRFTFKVPKAITHARNLEFSSKDVDDFIAVVESVGNKKGCLLAQFPPSLRIEKLNSLQNLLEALSEATEKRGWKIAVEFRNVSWYEREVYELLEEFNAAMVIHDMNKSATPISDVVGDFIYLRFHGPEPRYRGDYTDAFLKATANQIKKWLREKKTVYAYFNNTMGAAYKNLQTLNNYLK